MKKGEDAWIVLGSTDRGEYMSADWNGKPQYGPGNPHPLSTRKTELIWEGKYDEYGNRREVDVAGMAVPVQRINVPTLLP